MDKSENIQEIKDEILDAMEMSLEAQLKAVQKLRRKNKEEKKKPRKGRMSQLDMVYDILLRAGTPLHIMEIIKRVEMFHGMRLERESIVSALSKEVKKRRRFIRTDKNTFDILQEEED